VLAPPLERTLAALSDRVAARWDEPIPDGLEPGAVDREVEWEIAVGSDGRARAARLDDSGAPLDADDAIAFTVRGHTLRVSPGTFFQANDLLHDALLDAVDAAVGTGDRLLELHAGAGFFTLALAHRFASLQAVESGAGAVRDLRANLDTAGLRRVEVVHGRVEDVVPDGVASAPDVVLADPPRAGLGAACVRALVALAPLRIVHLSCDPATLARDVAALCGQGYALRSLEGFDLFPQTPHVEALAVLERGA
jgi:23S rRNA (uracil1939-C5)-methyltransferase